MTDSLRNDDLIEDSHLEKTRELFAKCKEVVFGW